MSLRQVKHAERWLRLVWRSAAQTTPTVHPVLFDSRRKAEEQAPGPGETFLAVQAHIYYPVPRRYP